MSPEELEALLNKATRDNLINDLKNEYSQTSTPGKMHSPQIQQVFWPDNNLNKSAPTNVGNTTKK